VTRTVFRWTPIVFGKSGAAKKTAARCSPGHAAPASRQNNTCFFSPGCVIQLGAEIAKLISVWHGLVIDTFDAGEPI
jgi:hypothetical protein